MANKFPKKKLNSLSIPLQKFLLIIKYKKFLFKDNSSRKLDMDFLIPSTNIINIKYTMKLKYSSLSHKPKVFVLTDTLPKRPNDVIPHIYETKIMNGKQYLNICPFFPNDDWNNAYSIADTVFLWAIEWIYFYELWIVTGQWSGRWNTSWKH